MEQLTQYIIEDDAPKLLSSIVEDTCNHDYPGQYAECDNCQARAYWYDESYGIRMQAYLDQENAKLNQNKVEILVPSKQLTPRKYQYKTIEYCTTPRVKLNETDLNPTLCRSLVTHVPGAGKTFCATESAKALVTSANNTNDKKHSTLVICPAHLVSQWFDFIATQYPDDHIVSIEGTSKQNKFRDLSRQDIDWLIVSVQSLRKKDFLEQVEQAAITNHVIVSIIDESHYIKNHSTKQSVNVRHLTRPAFIPHTILLSATPVVREADDLWHQLRVVDHISFRSQDHFLNRYCWFSYGSYGPTNVSLRRDAHKHLEGKVEPSQVGELNNNGMGWIYGLSYKDIGLELPPIIPTPNSPDACPKANFNKDLRKAYDDVKLWWSHQLQSGQTILQGDNAMEIMHLLRALTNCSEKRQHIIEYMETDPGPYLIGCMYHKSANDLVHDLKLAGYNPLKISGETHATERIKLAKQHGHHPKDVIVAIIPSISEGVDLSHFNTTYFYEEDYTPGKMYQFMSRVRRHRNTQDIDDANYSTFLVDSSPNEQGTFSIHMPNNPNSTPVICRYFHVSKTIDETIHLKQSNRALNVKDLIKVELNS